MNKIDRITSTGINPAISSNTPQQPITIPFHEKFHFPEIDLPERDASDLAPTERLNYEVMVNLFMEILQSGVDIIPQKPKDHGTYIVEASFRPSPKGGGNHCIFAPLRGVYEPLESPPQIIIYGNSLQRMVEKYVYDVINNSTDTDIIQLIVVIGHEFGHFLSFIRGYHDAPLQYGIQLMHQRQTTPGNAIYTWLVFREEVTAWRFAHDVLYRYKFQFIKEFEMVKHESLHVYYKTLHLKDANLDVYLKLAILGEDFTNSCNP